MKRSLVADLPDEPAALQDSENVHDSREVEAVLSRLVQSGLWRQGELAGGADHAPAAAPEAEASPSSAAVGTPRPAGWATSADGPSVGAGNVAGDGEESIESYMERLMKRVRGDAPAAHAAPFSAALHDSQPQSGATPPVAARPAVASEPACEESSEPYSPRRTAPELSTNLSAMRELANTAARSAIDRHVRQHTGRQVWGRLIGAGMTVTASLVVGFWAARAHSLPAAVAAAIGGGLGGYWSWAAFRRLAALRRINRVQLEKANSPQAAATPSGLSNDAG